MNSRVRRSTFLVLLALIAPPATAVASPSTEQIPLASKDFPIRSVPLGDDLYQAGWSTRNDVLWVTTTSHKDIPSTRIPERSAILKIDPDSLEVLDMIEPRVLDAGTDDERPEASYGLAIDDKHNRIWSSSTHEEAVVVHDQRTGDHVATIPGLGHARDIVIDPHRDTAYVSDPVNGVITTVSTRTLAVTGEIVEPTTDFSPMSLELVATPRSSTLYTVNLNDGALIEHDGVRGRTRVIALTGGERASGVAVDHRRDRAYVASQASADLRTVNLATGKVIAVAPASGAALNTDVDPRTGLVATALFTSNAVLVTDARTGVKIGEIALADAPHDVLVADDAIWVLDQADEGSSLWRIETGPCR